IVDSTPRTPQPNRRVNRAPSAVASNLPTSASRRAAAPRVKTPAAGSAPRLVLSGKRQIARAPNTPVALQLDTNLPGTARPPSSDLTATELSDENTALSRRLAHLEAQLAALQQRNAELESHRTAAPTVATPPAAQWPLYLLAMGLLIGAGTLAVWLHRRNRQPAEDLQDVWQPSEATVYDTAASDPLSQPIDMEPNPQRMSEISRPTLIESTEINDDILDQAEVYMAHGHGELAIHLLQEHLRETPAESPVPWLLLLDLLHRAGDTEVYAAASAECRSHFNINLNGHPISQENDIGLGLEAYPHLLEQLVSVWNSPDIDSFFHDLIYDNRGGTRVGFEPSAYRDILMLRAIAQDTLPLAA
ncbi:MAG: type IV pilus assembly protein FimV, partial [Thiobacillus sp.]